MSSKHIVKQGEHLQGIAKKYGFSDYHPVWDYPENADLKNKRKNPNILKPGDVLHIPDKETKEATGGTETTHQFRVHGKLPKLRIRLIDSDNNPMANTECEVSIGLNIQKLKTDGDGLLELTIPFDATTGELTLSGTKIPFQIGGLDPVEERSGWKARLRNLGYDPGPPDTEDESLERLAIEEFQSNHGLKVDGVCGSKTQAKLKEVHGC